MSNFKHTMIQDDFYPENKDAPKTKTSGTFRTLMYRKGDAANCLSTTGNLHHTLVNPTPPMSIGLWLGTVKWEHSLVTRKIEIEWCRPTYEDLIEFKLLPAKSPQYRDSGWQPEQPKAGSYIPPTKDPDD